MIDINNIIDDFIMICQISQINLKKSDIKIEILTPGLNHIPKALPSGHIAVYIFQDNATCYKVGKAHENSNARYQYQHYQPNSSKSNLAKSMISDKNFVTPDNIDLWIKQNLTRINLLLKKDAGILTLNLLEAFLHCRLNPKYEGYASQSLNVN
jgi:hypothetical protein